MMSTHDGEVRCLNRVRTTTPPSCPPSLLSSLPPSLPYHLLPSSPSKWKYELRFETTAITKISDVAIQNGP